MPKTTRKDFQLFQDECQRWIDYFGLKDIRVTYQHGGTNNDNNAEWLLDGEGRVALIKLGDTIDNKSHIQQSAFHEVTEGLLLGQVWALLENRYVTRTELDTAVHSVVRTLENTVFKDVKPTGGTK